MTERELDALIGAYVAEPPAGLAQRVLARTRRPYVWLAGLAGLAAAAVALLVVSVPRSSAPSVSGPAPEVSSPVAVVPAPLVRPVIRAPRARPRRGEMNASERRLLEFARAYPDLVQQVLVDEPKRMNEPLRIEAIRLDPIVIPPLEVVTFGGQ